MNNDAQRRKIGYILLGGIALLIVVILSLQTFSSPQPKQDNGQSAEEPATNTNTNVAVEENELATDTGPDYSALTEIGVSTRHIDGLQYGLYQYAQPKNINIKNSKVIEDSVAHTLPDDSKNRPYQTYDFQVKLDEAHTVKVQMHTRGLFKVRVIIFDSNTNTQVYDSGEFDPRNV